MKFLIFTLSLLAGLVQLKAQSFRGLVYLDENGNGIHDSAEMGLPGVAVSNGLYVVLTDEDGAYNLPDQKRGDFIFITTPAGFRAAGSHYQIINQNTSAYDFGLLPDPNTLSNNFSFIQITDTETYLDLGWVDPIRKYAANENIAFLVHTGDICYEKGLNFHGDKVNRETMGVPVYYCCGNHDLVAGEYGEKLFEHNFGPVYYSFDAGNVHFIVTPMLQGDFKPAYTKEHVYRWLVNDLALVPKEKSVVVFNHDLLTYGDEFNYSISDTEGVNLNDHNLKAWIYGHWHINYLKKHGDSGIISVSSSPPNKGGIDHSASNFLVYGLDENDQITVSPRYNYLDKHLVITTPSAENMTLLEQGKVTVSVNTYHTISPTVKVIASFDKAASEKEWVELKSNNSWNWSADLPVPQDTPNTRLYVKAIFANDEFEAAANSVQVNNTKKQTAPLKLQWINNTGGYSWMTKPVLADNKVFVAAMDEFNFEANFVLAYDSNSGELMWQFQTNNAIKNTICFENNLILATDIDGVTYAINSSDGSLVWEKELGQDYLPSYISGNTVLDGTLYTGWGNYLSAIEVASGQTQWVNKDWNSGEGTSSTHVVAKETLVTGSNWRALYGHDLETGKVKWKLSDDGVRFRSSSASYKEDTLFVLSQKGILLLDPETGNTLRKQDLPYDLQVATAPLVTRDHVIFGTSAEGLVALSRSDLQQVWKLQTGESLFYTAPYAERFSSAVETPPVLLGNNVYFGASDGFLYVLEIGSGKVVQKINLGAPVLAPVTIKDNQLYVTDFAGNLYAFAVE